MGGNDSDNCAEEPHEECTAMNQPNPPNPINPSPTEAPSTPPVGVGKAQAANLCAAGLGFCFFLPWFHFFLGRLSGFDYQKTSDGAKVLWLMPIFCVATLIAGLTGKSQKTVGQLAGVTPFAILIYAVSQEGGDMLKILEPGAWLALALGAALFVLVRR